MEKVSATTIRRKTMIQRLGEDDVALIDNIKFLPFYRSAQIELEKKGRADEWPKIIEQAKSAKMPNRYFTTLCKRIKNGTYRFTEKAKEVGEYAARYIAHKIKRFGFDNHYEKYWIYKINEFINRCSMDGFVELLELAERKKYSQRYFARAVLNCQRPRDYFNNTIRKAGQSC